MLEINRQHFYSPPPPTLMTRPPCLSEPLNARAYHNKITCAGTSLNHKMVDPHTNCQVLCPQMDFAQSPVPYLARRLIGASERARSESVGPIRERSCSTASDPIISSTTTGPLDTKPTRSLKTHSIQNKTSIEPSRNGSHK